MADREVLERIADAIVSGRDIDWDESGAEASPGLRDLLGELQIIVGISELHRAVADRLEGHPATDLASAPEHADLGEATRTWGPLRLLHRVASGAAGTVYRAWDPGLDREVALKLLHDTPSGSDTPIIEEGRLLARVRHPNVAAVYGAGQFEGRTGVWMEFVHGRTLEDVVSRDGPLPPADAVTVLVAVCRALQAAHDASLLHRDINAHNVMREPSGRVVLMDFHAGAESMASGGPMMVGTPVFLAPEILIEGRPASVRSDVFSVGVLGYRLLSGAFPFDGCTTIDDLRRAWQEDGPVPLARRQPGVPLALVAAIGGALARDPRARPPSADAFAAALERSLTTVAPGVAGASRQLRRWWWAAAALSACATAGVVLDRDGRQRAWAGKMLRNAVGAPAPATPGAGSIPVLPSLAELDWRGFAPTGAPTTHGRFIGGLVLVEPAVRDLVTGEVTVLQKQQHEDDGAGPVSVAPDGTWAAYSWHRAQPDGSERVEIRVAPHDGVSRLVLTDARVADARVVAWTPDQRGLLALLRSTDDERTLAVVDVASGSVRPLARLSGDEPSSIALSPDGATVAFDVAPGGNGAMRDIHVLDVTTGEVSPLIVTGSNDLYPCWSADGRALVFASDRDGTLGLWAVDVVGGHAEGQPHLVRSGIGRFRPLGFTARGELYFASESGTIDVYSVAVDSLGHFTSAPAVVAETFVGRNLDADWSPDGQRLVFVSRRGEVTFDRRSMSLVLRNLSDGAERRVTPDLDGIHDPRWSPDGRRIMFGGRTGDVDRLYVLEAATGEVRSLGISGLGAARWSPDGRHIYGARSRDGRWSIRVRDLREGPERELAWPVNMNFAVSPDEQWLATTHDTPRGSVVAVRAASGGEWHDVFPAERGDRVFAIEWMTGGDELLVSHTVASAGRDEPVTEVWAVALDGSSPRGSRRLGEIKGLVAPRKFHLSPDGHRLLFTAGSPNVTTWVMRGLRP